MYEGNILVIVNVIKHFVEVVNFFMPLVYVKNFFIELGLVVKVWLQLVNHRNLQVNFGLVDLVYHVRYHVYFVDLYFIIVKDLFGNGEIRKIYIRLNSWLLILFRIEKRICIIKSLRKGFAYAPSR